jgi:hypothetical protein
MKPVELLVSDIFPPVALPIVIFGWADTYSGNIAIPAISVNKIAKANIVLLIFVIIDVTNP